MKITAVRHSPAYHYRLERPIGDANGPVGNDLGGGSFVYVDTDEGVTGIAPGGGPHVRQLEHLLVGEDPRGVVGLWKKLCDHAFKGGVEGQIKAAIGALDVALWDLKARLNDEPLWRTLGASTPRVKAYASGIDLCLTDEELGELYGRAAALGIDAGKLKVGLDLDADRRRLQIVKDRLSRANPRPALMIDSNEYWSPKQAIRAVAELEETFDLTWVEEPARRWDYRGLRLVRESVRAAVATGENLNGAQDFYPLILNDAADVYEIGSGTTGITGAMLIGQMCAGLELPVAMMNCPANFMAHLAAALPNHLMMEVLLLDREPCFSYDNRIEDGFIVLGEAPGLGITVDEARLAALAAPGARRTWQDPQPFPRREGAGLWIKGLTAEEHDRRRRHE
jgi:L-alanine-DL-glutamate epimerase-like enolase superfamily enzyme